MTLKLPPVEQGITSGIQVQGETFKRAKKNRT